MDRESKAVAAVAKLGFEANKAKTEAEHARGYLWRLGDDSLTKKTNFATTTQYRKVIMMLAGLHIQLGPQTGKLKAARHWKFRYLIVSLLLTLLGETKGHSLVSETASAQIRRKRYSPPSQAPRPNQPRPFPSGQPENFARPPALSNAQADNLPIKGLSSYYWRTNFGYQLDSLQKNDPANTNNPIADQKHKLLLGGVIGWGPIRANDLFFNAHYSYKQDWKTDQGQFDQFTNIWTKEQKAEYFLFRTQDLLRTHELATDLRYINNYLQAGLFTRFTLSRVGSNLLGSEFEESRTVVKSENFVPYISSKYGRYYRGQLSLPFRTEINEDDKRLSNSSYSFSSSGRGFFLSYNLSNGFFVPKINSLFFIDMFYSQFKYASIMNDRDQKGLAISLDFPVIYRVRAAPKGVFYYQDYVGERVRIENFKKGSATESESDPVLIKREDTFYSAGGSIYIDFTESQRLLTSFVYNNTTSTIPEFNLVQTLFTLTYSYAWPRTSLVQKRVQRFQENTYAEEF